MEYQINDPKNIIGLSSLMKNDNDNYDITNLEQEIINGANLLVNEEEDVTNQYKQDMDRLSTTFNIDDFTNIEPKNNYYSDNYGNGGNVGNADNTSFNPQSFLPDDRDRMEDQQLKYMTLEQKKQNYVDEVFHDMGTDETLEFDIDKEKDEDDKNALLEQIDMLRDTLDDDGINLMNVPQVTKNNSTSDINNIYKILRLKNDRNRYCSFAEELILSGAYGLEYLFDGKNDWLGRKPDLVGWSNTVRIKLRRCRFQTSTLIKDMMQDYNMGPGIQLLLELIPSIFLYSRAKKLANNDTAAENMRYDDAISNLNESFDNK